jgi:pimeloyl-ACP methyl ester carboxylesterase
LACDFRGENPRLAREKSNTNAMNRFHIQLALFALFLPAIPAIGDEFNSDGVPIHYTVTGSGEPVILVHGLYSSAELNWTLPGTTAALAKHYQVIALDNRGHGQSGKPHAEGAYGTNMVEDVVRLMDHLRIQKARVVGYSLGGMLVMKLAATHPDRVSAVVLGGMGWLKAGSPLDRFWENIQGRTNALVPVACLHGIAQLGVTEADLKSLRIPVVIVVGDRDPCRRLYVEPLHHVRPDWPVHLIPDAGHLNCSVKPEFKEQVLSALAGKAP